MLRFDFVSNSSSTSFILSINKSYNLKKFCEDVAKTTISQNEKDHENKNLLDRNISILNFCLNTYELLFLGSCIIKTKELITSKEEYIKKPNYGGERMWNFELEQIEECKKPNCQPFIKEMYGKNYIDKDGKLHHFYDVEAFSVAVDKHIMTSRFCRHEVGSFMHDHENDPHSIEYRLKSFKEFFNRKYSIFESFVHTYQITINTINNTKFLIDNGFNIRVDKKLMTKLETLLNNGDKILYIRNNYSGDGYDCYSVYSENDAKFLDKVSAVVLESEVM